MTRLGLASSLDMAIGLAPRDMPGSMEGIVALMLAGMLGHLSSLRLMVLSCGPPRILGIAGTAGYSIILLSSSRLHTAIWGRSRGNPAKPFDEDRSSVASGERD